MESVRRIGLDAPFEHLASGTPSSQWDDSLADLSWLELPGGDPLVVLAAHPDDETLGAGGVIALAASQGARITVIVATDGEASHPESTSHTAAQLAAIRRLEAQRAVRTLAPSAELIFLGLPDSDLSSHLADIQSALAAALAGLADQQVLLLSPWEADRHPDHEVCAAAARAVAAGHPLLRHWQYPIWLWHWGVPGAAGDAPLAAMRRVALSGQVEDAREQALASYVSQTGPLSPRPGDEAVLSASFLDHFRRPFDVLIDPYWRPAAAGSYFEKLYVSSDDPWALDSRWYEKRKRRLVLDSLPRQRFRRAFEPGCAGGQLTEELARRCQEVVAVDVATAAVRLAQERCRSLPGVTLETMQIPEQWPTGSFDLVVLSEVAYYCTDLVALARRVRDCLEPDGVLVLCHWRHRAVDHPHSAEHAHAALRAGTGLNLAVSHVEVDFLLEVLTVSSTSVAGAEEILD